MLKAESLVYLCMYINTVVFVRTTQCIICNLVRNYKD